MLILSCGRLYYTSWHLTRGPVYNKKYVRPHNARIFLNCLLAVNTLPRPTKSPDLSPIEHVWDMIERQIWGPQNIADLEQQLVNSWQNVLQEASRNFYHSLPRRIQACITAVGGSTNY
ncbi:transposable element Tc1 transposase [Trichonephila clavipes]|nr:transposable element Tc1 transposase [Trichonephila clavipes]